MSIRGTAPHSAAGRAQLIVRLHVAALALAVLGGCGEAVPGANASPATLPAPANTWAVASEPEVSIGTAEGDESYLLHEVSSVVRMANGSVFVLNAGSNELRTYDAAGRHVRTVGRTGNGPGEFRRPARIYVTHPDSLLIYDPGTGLESRFDSAGAFVRAEQWQRPKGEPFGRDAWLYRHTLVNGPRTPDGRAPVRRLIDRLPATAPGEFRVVRVDDFGRVWVRREPHDPDAPSTWEVYALTGEPLAQVTTPARFEVQFIGADFVAGRSWDGLGVERAQVWAMRDAQVPRVVVERAAEPVAQNLPVDGAADAQARSPIQRQMSGMLRDAVSQQEIFYSQPENGYRYAWRADQLQWPEDMQGITVHITTSGPRGYTMLAFHESESIACGVTMGLGGPLGWTPGIVACR